jgi:hypothetical protein
MITVRGRLSGGVEPGCVVLAERPDRIWLLIGGDRSKLVPGREVQVRGERRAGTITTCQQGTPLFVHTVRAF